MVRRKESVIAEDEMELTPEQLKVQKEILKGLGRPTPFKKRKRKNAVDNNFDTYSVVGLRLRNSNSG